MRSQARERNERWAMDVTRVHCGDEGWAHLSAVIDCHDRELIGYEFSLRARAREPERALEEACIEPFGTLPPEGQKPVVHSDNGLIFQSRRFREACREYRLPQEFITPYTPEQNGMIERFFQKPQRRVRMVASIRFFCRSKAPHQQLRFRTQQLQQVA